MNFVLLIIITFVLNIPAGYFRENYKRLSIMWFIILHLPIPGIIALRYAFGYGGYSIDRIGIIALLITIAILGQFVGSKPVRKYILANKNSPQDDKSKLVNE